ncbi:hypothetical protein BABINDRAFT_162884 [Babjeviella inositovora NRRL Y-12698]|uniref:FAD dependent oxidoreductase domain-containing protein n=1 Tax=Babjeviella inositovora NRRL Y-12698 TaxID=984486 RepID=A0A1E3QKS5_9ASCO|nr:uncharacterized protein BABINDRAFT_162884 [Babjeviella inositovora NRRL Y-12698]ODQ78218.1 hypothetical protein BABINDRAFT_162884 [Babjeviella inositovora NRRL Y-12698]
MTSEYLQFSSIPSGAHKGKHHIIIVGAGIIGVCTAYYLTRHPAFDPATHHITIIESKRVAGGASGKAGGLLALWAFPQQIVPMSFQLHQELSSEYNGEEEWAYRRLTTVSIEGNIEKELKDNDSLDDSDASSILSSHKLEDEMAANGHTSDATTVASNENIDSVDPYGCKDATKPTDRPSKIKVVQKNSIKNEHFSLTHGELPNNLKWIKPGIIRDWSYLGDMDSTAQVHPYKFTNFILKKAMEVGGVELVLGKVNEILYDEETGATNGVSYDVSSVKTQAKETTVPIELHGNQIVLSVGPWTSKILPDCPISGLRAHSITIAPDRGQVSPYAIFTELAIGQDQYISPEIYARKDEVYVCGEGDTLVDVPETTDDVEVVKEKCDILFEYVGTLSPNLQNGRILKRQACYLPVLDVPSSSGPLIGETNVENLFLASGHSCWGINNAPGTGKIMAELLLDGVVECADISALDPSLFFDASVLNFTA